MTEAEHASFSELPSGKLDVLIVMGRNFLPGYDREKIKAAKHHLGPESRMNVWAAAILVKTGIVDRVLFSTGFTAGSDIPSEAQAMQDLFVKILHLSSEQAEKICLKQEKSRSTDPESKEDKRLIDKYGFKNVGLVTTGGNRSMEKPAGHIDRAAWWFNKRGLKVTPFITEEVLKGKFPRFVNKYLASELSQKVAHQERLAIKIERAPFDSGLGSLILQARVALTRR